MLMAACAFIGTQHRDVSVFKNLCFHPSPKKKNVFEKMSFHRIRVNGGQNWRKKISRFQTKTDTC